jgi:PAS domain S-box-containing protein
MAARSSFESRYRRSLAAHVAGADNEEALDLGRSALAEGRSLLDVMAVHQAAVPALVKSSRGAELRRRFEKTDEFLSQAVAPFEMINRGWREMVDRLRDMNEQLERQVAERTAALRESEQRFRDVAEVAGDWIWETDRDHRFTFFAGESLAKLAELGATPQVTIGKTRWELAGADPRQDENWRRHKEDLDSHLPFRHFRYSLVTPAGVRRYMSVSGKPVVSVSGDFVGYRGTATDETATFEARSRLQELQDELLHVSRFSAMGQMGSALAHEINQPLAAISNYLGAGRHILERGSPQPAGKMREILDKASEQAIRAGEIIRQLRSFVAKGETERRPEEIGTVVEEATTLAMIGSRHQGVRLSLRLDPNASIAVINRVQIQQVLVNLVRNAVEAMSEGPRRELSVATRGLGDGGVEFEIADTGPGLAPEVSRRLFKPFVSTKSHGMGVGLSICQSIIEAHGGRIWAVANPGGGTVFHFSLPHDTSPD